MDKVYLGIIVVLVLIVAYVGTQSGQYGLDVAEKASASAIVEELYELQYESDAEILSVSDQNGLYKVIVRFTDFAGQSATQDVFVTKDGELLTDRLIITENYKNALANQKSFAECLADTGLRILGKTDDTATLQQLDVLGTYAYKVFVSCDGPSEQACIDLGVQRYPTTVYNNTGFDNLYNPQFFAELTGCELPQ